MSSAGFIDMWRGSLVGALFLTLAAGLVPDGADAAEIKVGISAALTGPAEALGQGMRQGIEAYFKRLNAAGGINGNTVRLIALDDKYEPDLSAPNMYKLIDEEHVLAVVGNVGTPTAVVTVPIANEKKTLLFGSYTGAGVLRKSPPDRYVFNFRASYAEETSAIIEAILAKGIKPEQIAFFTQNDGYGEAGYQGAVAALKARGFQDANKLAHGRYTRNTVNVEGAVAAIIAAKVEPRVVVMVGAYKPTAAFIKMARQELPKLKFVSVSFVGSLPLANELGASGEGVVVTQVVPHFDANLPAVTEYRQSMKEEGSSPDFISLEGYLVARIFTEAVKKAGAQVSRETIIDALESTNSLDIGIGVPVSYSPGEHQGCHKIWPTVLKGGRFVPFEWKEW